jgi:hypothetical protein
VLLPPQGELQYIFKILFGVSVCGTADPIFTALYNTNKCVLMTQFTGLLKDSGVLVFIITSVVLNSAAVVKLSHNDANNIRVTSDVFARIRDQMPTNEIYVAGTDNNTLTWLIALLYGACGLSPPEHRDQWFVSRLNIAFFTLSSYELQTCQLRL